METGVVEGLCRGLRKCEMRIFAWFLVSVYRVFYDIGGCVYLVSESGDHNLKSCHIGTRSRIWG